MGCHRQWYLMSSLVGGDRSTDALCGQRKASEDGGVFLRREARMASPPSPGIVQPRLSESGPGGYQLDQDFGVGRPTMLYSLSKPQLAATLFAAEPPRSLAIAAAMLLPSRSEAHLAWRFSVRVFAPLPPRSRPRFVQRGFFYCSFWTRMNTDCTDCCLAKTLLGKDPKGLGDL